MRKREILFHVLTQLLSEIKWSVMANDDDSH